MSEDAGKPPVDPFAGLKSIATKDGVVVDAVAPAAAPDAGPPAAPEPAAEADDPLAAFSDTPEPDEGVDDEPATQEVPPGDEKPKPVKSAKKRIAELTKARRQAEARLLEMDETVRTLKSEIDAIKQSRPPASEPVATPEAPAVKLPDGSVLTAPDPSKYRYGEVDSRYLADLNRYGLALARQQARAELEETARQAADRAMRVTLAQEAQKLSEKGATLFEDYEDVVIDGARSQTWALSETIFNLAAKSEVGAQALYHLARNPGESRKVYAMTTAEQGYYFGKLEAALAAKARRTPALPQVPAPPNAPRGAGGRFVDAGSASFEQFEAMVRAKTAQK